MGKLKEIKQLCNTKASIISVSFSPDGSEVACGTMSLDIVFCKIYDNTFSITTLEYRGGLVKYSPNNGIIASSIDEDLFLSAPGTGKFLQKLEWHKNAILGIAFSSDGRKIATGGREELFIYDIETGMPVQRFSASDIITDIVFTPDGERLITSNRDKTLSVWGCKSGVKLHLLKGHTDEVRCVAVHPSANYAISGGYDKTLRLWNINYGTEIQHYDCFAPIKSIAFLTDGRHAVCGCHGSIVIVDLKTGEIIANYNEAESCFYIDVSLHSNLIASGSNNGLFRLWEISF